MLSPLSNPVFARLFSAQVTALLGTGLLTVALGLLAFDLAGADAATVLATAYGIKMVAYVGLSPVMAALTQTLPRRAVLITADIARAAVAVTLPFITEVWQIYLAIFALQTASATFTPVFQATIPDIFPDENEDDYARALSLSRLAYDVENLASPALAGLLLLMFSYHWLFAGTALGFVISMTLIRSTTLPAQVPMPERPFRDRLTRGVRIYLATPRLRGLLALTLAAAALSAFVIVNTVVVVRQIYGFDDEMVPVALASYGAGSMLCAILLPRLLHQFGDRPVMMTSGGVTVLVLLGSAMVWIVSQPAWLGALAVWSVAGAAYAGIVTPAGRLLRQSANAEDRAAVFTAQFALSHACWLLTYPLAGWTMSGAGVAAALGVLGGTALLGVVLALWVWPRDPARGSALRSPALPSEQPLPK